MNFIKLCCILCFIFLFDTCLGARTKEKIYVDVGGHHACFRRLNATHQIGCSSGRNGNVGVVHYVENETDLNWVIDNGPHAPYVILMEPTMFKREYVAQLNASKKINGILLIHSNDTAQPPEFSTDHPCPNENMDLYASDPKYAHCKNVTWNSVGSSMFYDDHDFPIIAISNYTEVQELIHNCYKAYNEPNSDGSVRQYPLCAAELKDAMDGAVDTPTCIRRSNMVTNLNPQVYCDAMGGYNVYGFIHPINGSDKTLRDDSIVMAAARLDSFSMFDKQGPGVDSAISGIVTLLAAAEALAKVKHEMVDAPNPLMFTFFNGEAFEYIGSMRVAYDMMKNEFPYKIIWDSDLQQIGPHPIQPKNLHTFLEVSQVGLEDEGKLWVHTDPVSRGDASVDAAVTDLLSILKTEATSASLGLDNSPQIQPLPPASFQSFLKKENISGVVISDHKASYTNKYYHSMYEDLEQINNTYPDGLTPEEKYNYVTSAAEQLSKLATVTARTLFKLSTGNSASASVQVNSTFMANLLYCYAVDPICELFNQSLNPDETTKITKAGMNYYVGVSGNTIGWVTQTTRYLLHVFLGEEVPLSQEQCKDYKDGDTYEYDKCCGEIDEQKNDMFYKYLYVNGPIDNTTSKRIGKCMKSTVNDSKALSPAFDIDDYDWSSNQYSAWTESRWANDAIFVRYFLVPPLDMELTLLFCSLAVFAGAMVAAFFMEKKAKVLFAPPRNILNESSDLSDMNGYGSNSSTTNQVNPIT